MESWPVLLLLGIVLVIFASGVIRLTGKMVETAKNRKIAEYKIEQLKKEKEKLSANIKNLETDEGVEASIREKFGLAKDGEEIIIVVEDKNKPAVPKTETGGFFSFFKNWFK